ncbi:MAG: fumarylacetoacetate hydrolase family protein [Flavobacterium sp.]|nr:fumarylacetoacetate hydrolase family protein [Pedobacter sp.]
MKLIRFGEEKNEKPGILNEQDERLDLSGFFQDWDSNFFASGGLEKLREIIASGKNFPVVSTNERWGPCVARPYKIICIGLNYSDHAEESGMKIPGEPIIFMKASNTLVGPYDEVYIPKNSSKTDWEVELGVIVGKEASYLNSPEEAKDCIAGYCISHDVSERAFQLEKGGQWTKGKSCKSFNPLGPFMSTADETLIVNELEMELKVNDVVMQHGNTNKMIFDVDYIVWYLSQFMVLEPGDVISTGTPPGVGMGKKPPLYLKAGDVVELTIEGLGKQKQTFVQA